MRLLSVFLIFILAGCACASAESPQTGPRFANPIGTIEAGARLCADHGYSYVVRTGPHEVYCIHANFDDESEAVPVGDALLGSLP